MQIIIRRIGIPLTKLADKIYEVHYERNRRKCADDLWSCILRECPKQPENKWSKNRLISWLERNKLHCISYKRKGTQRIVHVDLSKAPNIQYIINRCKPHVIKPKRKQCLHFLKEGKEFFIYSQVNHPGKRPNNFIYRAARRYSAKYLSKLTRITR